MKKATLRIAAVYMTCPYCKGDMENPFNGSLMHEPDTFVGGAEVQCDNCYKYVKIPTVKSVKLPEYNPPGDQFDHM